MQQRRLVKVLSIGCLTGLAGLAAIRELIARCSDKLDRTAVNAECIARAQKRMSNARAVAITSPDRIAGDHSHCRCGRRRGLRLYGGMAFPHAAHAGPDRRLARAPRRSVPWAPP